MARQQRKDSLRGKSKIHKRVKVFIPDQDGNWFEESVTIMFHKEIEWFYIIMPDHVRDVIRDMPLTDREVARTNRWSEWPTTLGDEVNPSYGVVTGSAPKDCIEILKSVCATYVHWIKTLVAEKTIGVRFAFNVDWVEDFHADRDDGLPVQRQHMRGQGSPALAVSHFICYKVNDLYYTKDKAGRFSAMTNHSDYRQYKFIPHTAEREAFLDNVHDGLTAMICNIIQFFDNPVANIDKAIEHKTGFFLGGK